MNKKLIKVNVIYLWKEAEQEFTTTIEVPYNFEETTNNIIWLSKKIERLFDFKVVAINKITYL